jgi:hypothetical protein
LSSLSFSAGSGVWTFAATSGTQTITTGAKTLGPLTQSGAGGTVALGDALTLGTTRTYTYTAGTLSLNDFTLTCGLFSSSNTNTRVIQFGTGAITINGTGTVLSIDGTNLTYTGTSTVNIGAATSGTVTMNTGFTETNALNVNYTGSWTLTETVGSNTVYKNITLTSFIGTLPNTARTIYGNWTNPASAGTYTAGGSAQEFSATSGTQTITTNGRTLDFPFSVGGGTTTQLAGALTLGTTRTLQVFGLGAGGTLDLTDLIFLAGDFLPPQALKQFYLGQIL